MQDTDGDTWIEWLESNKDSDETAQLEALRGLILAEAKRSVEADDIKADWANKKLPLLGITEQIPRESSYLFTAPVAGTLDLRVFATSRADALVKVAEILNRGGGSFVKGVAGAGAAVLIEGPEDVDLTVAGDAPSTVDDTLARLREIVMLGVIAGPHLCKRGVDDLLASFGLAPLPETKRFTVSVPIEGEMLTEVEAFDEDSARRVAGWRWSNGRSGYQLSSATDTDVVTVAFPS